MSTSSQPSRDATAEAEEDVTTSRMSNMSIDQPSDVSMQPPQPPQSGDNGNGTSRSSYLTPLQHSLIHELTTRRTRIAKAQQRIDFWREREEIGEQEAAGQQQQQFGPDVVDEAFIDDMIQQRKKKLAELRQAHRLKEAIVESADAAHSINASMSAVPPAPFSATSDSTLTVHDVPPEQQPLRSMVTRRDQLALQFLRLDEQVSSVRRKRAKPAKQIDLLRERTSLLVAQIQRAKATLEVQREADMTASRMENNGAAYGRIGKLKEKMEMARGKREMVKGVLRGLVLESGLDWYSNKNLQTLVLSLADEDLNSSDEEVILYSSDEEKDKGGKGDKN